MKQLPENEIDYSFFYGLCRNFAELLVDKLDEHGINALPRGVRFKKTFFDLPGPAPAEHVYVYVQKKDLHIDASGVYEGEKEYFSFLKSFYDREAEDVGPYNLPNADDDVDDEDIIDDVELVLNLVLEMLED